MAKKGRQPGQISTLYSVWRNKDDELLILDGTLQECCDLLGMAPQTIRRLAVRTEKTRNEGGLYTVCKAKVRDVKREEES
jgi:hypothetical protein